MKKEPLLLILLSLIILSASCSSHANKKLSKKAIPFLATGDYDIYIMDSIKRTSFQKSVLKKFEYNVAHASPSLSKFLESIPEGKKLPFSNNLGLTKKEYDTLIGIEDGYQRISTAKEKLTIINSYDYVQFKGTGKLKLLDSLQISLTDSLVHFKGYTLKYIDTITVSAKQSGLGKAYFADVFSYAEEAKGIAGLYAITNDSNKINYSFIIGRINNSDDYFIALKGKEIKDNKILVNIELPILIK